MTNAQIATDILDQLGGLQLLHAMIGARDALAIEGGVQFKFMRTERTTANTVRITVEPADTYRIEWFKVGRLECKPVGEELRGVYADDLRRLFEECTGLVLTMPRVFRRVPAR